MSEVIIDTMQWLAILATTLTCYTLRDKINFVDECLKKFRNKYYEDLEAQKKITMNIIDFIKLAKDERK